mmetsp:Transcript_34294/g.78163  ORF Transcript_34294/g.78163 Transcript_34294/m.78163 type:complete len:494 (+) Transcript_34294:37-1518(+)
MRQLQLTPTHGMDPYCILQIPYNSSPEEIRSAYRRRMLSAFAGTGNAAQSVKQRQIVWALEAMMQQHSAGCQIAEAHSCDSSHQPCGNFANVQDVAGGTLRSRCLQLASSYQRAASEASSRRTSIEVALADMKAVLASMSRDERRVSIANLPRQVRAVLLHHMEQRTAAHGTGVVQVRNAVVADRPIPRGGQALPGALSHKAIGPSRAPAQKPGKLSTQGTTFKEAMLNWKTAKQADFPRAALGSSGLSGISVLRRKVLWYKASTCFYGLTISTGYTKSLSIAIDRHLLLLQVKHRTMAQRSKHKETEEALEAALEEVLQAAGVRREDVGLSFRMSIPAYRHIGRSIFTHSTTSASEAFHWGRTMRDALENGWQEFRDAWVHVMCACRQHTYNTVRKRSITEAQAFADKAWEEAVPYRAKLAARQAADQEMKANTRAKRLKASEEALTRALSRSCRKVERAIAQQQRAQRIQRKLKADTSLQCRRLAIRRDDI